MKKTLWTLLLLLPSLSANAGNLFDMSDSNTPADWTSVYLAGGGSFICTGGVGYVRVSATAEDLGGQANLAWFYNGGATWNLSALGTISTHVVILDNLSDTNVAWGFTQLNDGFNNNGSDFYYNWTETWTISGYGDYELHAGDIIESRCTSINANTCYTSYYVNNVFLFSQTGYNTVGTISFYTFRFNAGDTTTRFSNLVTYTGTEDTPTPTPTVSAASPTCTQTPVLTPTPTPTITATSTVTPTWTPITNFKKQFIDNTWHWWE